MKLIRLPEVRQRTGLSRSAVYQKMKDAEFPHSIRIGARTAAWLESDVEAWIEAQVRTHRDALHPALPYEPVAP